MKKLSIVFMLLLIVSCQKNSTIKWVENKSFGKIVEKAGDKYVMIDFVKDG